MKLKTLLFHACAGAALIAFAGPAGAAIKNQNQCVAGQPTAASYTWDFHGEANTIFANLQTDAREAVDHAGRLQSYTGLSWDSHAYQLDPLRTEVNDMGAMLCRLEAIRRVAAPWQQKTIDHVAIALQLMANNTEDAIQFGETHPNDLWTPRYQGDVNNLYNEAQALTHNLGEAVQYSHVSQEYRDLGHELRGE